MRMYDIPSAIRGEFLRYFSEVHDAIEEEEAPDTDECDDVEHCFMKIGEHRMAGIYRDFIAQAPEWVRQIRSDPDQYND